MTIAEALVANYLGDGGIISSEQIGIEANIEWGKLIAQLFKICRGLRNSENWSDVSELHQLPEENEIYDLLQQLLGIERWFCRKQPPDPHCLGDRRTRRHQPNEWRQP